MSVYNPQNSQSFLQELENMSTDIRATKQMIADTLAATQAAQATADTAQSSAIAAQNASDANSASIQSALNTIAANAGAMVRKFGPVAIASSEFIQNTFSGVYEYYLSHGLNDEAPDVEVLDSQREKQLIQSIGVDENSVKLELTADDMTGNAWPLYAIVIGKPGSVLPVAAIVTNFKQLGSRANYYQLVNGTVDHSVDGVTVTDSMVMLNVSNSYMLTGNGRVYFAMNDGTYFHIDGTQPTSSIPVEITQVIFDSTSGFPDRVAL